MEDVDIDPFDDHDKTKSHPKEGENIALNPEGVMGRVLSRIFVWGDRSILKNCLSHSAARKNLFRPSRGSGACSSEKF